MMHIKYLLDKSKHHGIGLFTAENLKKGQLIYTASPLLDVNITQKQFDSLSEEEKDEFMPPPPPPKNPAKNKRAQLLLAASNYG